MSIQDHYAVIQDNLLLGRCPYYQKELEDIKKTGMGASAVLSGLARKTPFFRAGMQSTANPVRLVLLYSSSRL